MGQLGQSAPAATTLTDCYTVPAAKNATIKITVCNRGSVADAFRVAISPGGAAIANAHYIAYDIAIAGNDAVVSAAVLVGATDVIRVYSTLGSLSFSVTGIEEAD